MPLLSDPADLSSIQSVAAAATTPDFQVGWSEKSPLLSHVPAPGVGGRRKERMNDTLRAAALTIFGQTATDDQEAKIKAVDRSRSINRRRSGWR